MSFLSPSVKYVLGSILAIPLLPIMYLQGRKIKAEIPPLPEASGTEGYVARGVHKKFSLLAIGESTIAGVGVETHEAGFTGALARALSAALDADVNWKVYARSGFTAQQVTEKIIPEISEKSVDLIVIGLGGNDAFFLNSPWRWRKHINQLIDATQLKFKNTPIVFTNMPPIKAFPAFTLLIKFIVGNLGEILGDTLENTIRHQQDVYFYARKVTLEDWIERLKVNAELADFFSDGVHPSKLTYEIWAKDVASFIISEENITNNLSRQITP